MVITWWSEIHDSSLRKIIMCTILQQQKTVSQIGILYLYSWCTADKWYMYDHIKSVVLHYNNNNNYCYYSYPIKLTRQLVSNYYLFINFIVFLQKTNCMLTIFSFIIVLWYTHNKIWAELWNTLYNQMYN